MRYTLATFSFNFIEEWQYDLFTQQLFDLGFDTIDENRAYIQSVLWEQNHDDIEQLCANTDGVNILSIEECPDENWNATWESEHPIQELPLGIKIIPRCAFGAGHHETTSMMIDTLVSTDLSNKNILDHGTGTGVLAIYAKRLGASKVIAIDIDEKSIINAQENAVLNGQIIDITLGTTVPYDDKENQTYASFDLIMANIHRNILLDNMHAYASSLNIGGELWLSGFYKEDCPIIIEEAKKNNLKHTNTNAKGEWYMLQFTK